MKLIIGNSESQLKDFTITQFSELRELLSYQIDTQAAYFSKNFNRTRYLVDKKGVFPTGLLYIVNDWIKVKEYGIEIHDHRKRPEALQGLFTLNLNLSPYPEQLEASYACSKNHRGIITMPTGTGKSVVIALTIWQLQLPTLVVVPTLELKAQLTEFLSKMFGNEKVGVGRPIQVENVASVDFKPATTKFGCVIIDEFHHSGAATYRSLNKKAWKDVYYRFGFTATPFRSQDNERLLLESVLSKIIYRLEYKTAIDKGYIVPVEAYYYEVPKTKSEGYTWSQVYAELVVNNKVRNELITTLLKNLYAANKSTLCLVKEIKHGEDLAYSTGAAFANGQTDETPLFIKAFNEEKLTILIGTTGVLGEGIDTRPAEFIIIAGLGKSKNQFMQQVGRGLRRYLSKNSCKVIIFNDRSHKWSLAHFKAQRKYLLEEYGVEVQKLEL